MSTLDVIVDRIKQFSGVDRDAEVAEVLGISKGKLATAKARGSIPYRDLVAYSMKSGASLDWLLTGEGPAKRSTRRSILAVDDNDWAAKFVHVPLHDVQGSCGDGSVIHSEQIVDYLAFKREWISRVATDPKRLALIEAAGDSMMPTIHSGDLLLIDLCVTRVEQDAIYAINVEGMLYIKRIQKRLDGTVIVKSDNPAYEEQRFDSAGAEALRIVGRVIWMGKRV